MFRVIKKNTGIIVLVLIGLSCFILPCFFSETYLDTNIEQAYHSPCKEFLLGTDGSGRDVLLRLLYGGRVSVFVALVAMITEVIIGVTLGIISGISNKSTDRIIMSFSDIVMCLPVICIVLILGCVMSDLNAGVFVREAFTAVVIAILGWPVTARLIRAKVKSLKECDFIISLNLLQIPKHRILFFHIIPNLAPQILTAVTLASSGAVISEATLSFLGFGVSFPYPSWGNMIASVNNISIMKNYWWVWVPACVMIVLLVVSINLIGENLFEKANE